MKQTTKNILGVGAIILLSSGVAGLTTYKLLQSNEAATETSFNEMFKQNPNVKLAAFDAVNAQPVDLTQAAENSLHAVVHIRSTQEAKTRTVQQAPDIFDFFFGDGRGQQRQVQTQPRVGFGSGVIISKDGYIVTQDGDWYEVKKISDETLADSILPVNMKTPAAGETLGAAVAGLVRYKKEKKI